jgi:oxygen-independent coproporphyrinogen III oxidase
VHGIERELELRALGAAAPVDTIYLGGGTPSKLGPDGVARVIDAVVRRFPPAADAELTIEANPDDVTPAAITAWRASGVNRISLGAQSFDDRALAWMHRTHDSSKIMEAADALRSGGIENWSLDLIFALPPSLERRWERDVARAVELAPPHISLYGLTVEAHTPIARWRSRGDVVEGTEDTYETEYLHADRELTSAGYLHYEVSNFGQAGRSSRHNRGYWNGASYVGLGPSAHGFDGNARRWNEREYAAWLARLANASDPIAGSEELTDENRLAEQVYLGLRTTDGLVLNASELERVAPWVAEGWAKVDQGRLRLSPLGWLRLDALAASLTALRSR